MKKFCNKISTQQWRVTVPNLNSTIFRKSTSSSEIDSEKKRVSSGSYDLPAAQLEYDLRGTVSQSRQSLNSGTSSTDSYQDACQDNNGVELYDVVDVQHNLRIVESKNLTESNNKYEYDVPQIHFSFENVDLNRDKTEEGQLELHQSPSNEKGAFENHKKPKKQLELHKPHENEKHAYENHKKISFENVDLSKEKTEGQLELHHYPSNEKHAFENHKKSKIEENIKVTHKSQLQILVTNVIDFDDNKSEVTGNPVIKFGSDPNLNLLHHHQHNNDSGSDNEDDEFYKVPRRINTHQNRLSKSLHDFNMDELNLPQLSLSDESIEHISCSQVLPVVREESQSPSMNSSSQRKKSTKSRRLKAADKWENFKSKFNRVMEEHANQQRVGAFADKDKIVINIEGMYKSSKNKCKRIFKTTGMMFKSKRNLNQENVDPNSVDSSSQIIKNDAFFAKIKASDIEYVLPKRSESEDTKVNSTSANSCDDTNNTIKCEEERFKNIESSRKRISGTFAEEVMQMKNGFRKSRLHLEGQNGFDDLRRYVKQGGDFCKELAAILQERSDAELQYSKSLSKLGIKLSRACREGVGGLNEAWKAVAVELETRAEAHRHMSNILLEETAKPLKNLSDNQHRQRKNSEGVVDKAAKVLSEWRAAEAKSKKHSHACARDNEKLQDAMLENRMSRSTSLIQLPNIHKTNTDKDSAKLEGKKRKAEDAVKKADIDYYSHCVRSERARLEWESAVVKGASTFQTLEEDRLNNLKSTLSCYLKSNAELTPKLADATEKIRIPIENSEAQKDLSTFLSLRQSSQQTSEQLLPDFYCEHITLAMNRERRKQALVKLLQLIKLDIEREKKSKDGLENLSKAIKQTPNFGSEDSQQTVAEKLYHMKSMLTYLEGAKYKVQSALAELDCRPRTGHPLASHITITRDKAGLQQSILKAPLWLREQWSEADESKIDKINNREGDYDVENNWIDRGMADGNSNQHDSDFDEFSSQGSSICGGNCPTEETSVQPIAQCKALYTYTPNLPDELAIRPGDKVVVYRQQEDGWWLGECNGNVGIFPATYVETIKT